MLPFEAGIDMYIKLNISINVLVFPKISLGCTDLLPFGTLLLLKDGLIPHHVPIRTHLLDTVTSSGTLQTDQNSILSASYRTSFSTNSKNIWDYKCETIKHR